MDAMMEMGKLNTARIRKATDPRIMDVKRRVRQVRGCECSGVCESSMGGACMPWAVCYALGVRLCRVPGKQGSVQSER